MGGGNEKSGEFGVEIREEGEGSREKRGWLWVYIFPGVGSFVLLQTSRCGIGSVLCCVDQHACSTIAPRSRYTNNMQTEQHMLLKMCIIHILIF